MVMAGRCASSPGTNSHPRELDHALAGDADVLCEAWRLAPRWSAEQVGEIELGIPGLKSALHRRLDSGLRLGLAHARREEIRVAAEVDGRRQRDGDTWLALRWWKSSAIEASP